MRKILLTSLILTALSFGDGESPPKNNYNSLFDGETLSGWSNQNGNAIEEGKWTAEGGVLTRAKDGAGNLYSSEEYGDFDFIFEWKIEKGSNSGVKYRVQKIDGKMLGLEYQILDDENHRDNKKRSHQTAALYDLKTTIAHKPLKPIGEWNQSRIIVHKGLIQHYLNQILVVEINIPSQEWEKAYSASKYSKSPGFGVNTKGRLMLQDHGNTVSFRNLKIRNL